MRSERGSILILVALSTVALLSVAALSIDASFMFDLKNRLSSVADSAAKSAAFEVKRKNTAPGFILNYAQAEVTRAAAAGLIPSGVTIEAAQLCSDAGATCSAPYIGTGYVEVILSKSQATFFAPIFGYANIVPRGRAVAGIAAPSGCFTSMHNLTLGTSTLNGSNCSVTVGGNLIGTTPGATIDGTVLISGTGTCSGKSCDPDGGFGDWTAGQPAAVDPFADLLPLTPPACAPATTASLTAGCYTTIPDVPNLTLGPGVFFVSGTWDFHNNNILTATSGTLIYILGSGILMGNQATFHITASNTITGYEGIAMYGEPGSQMTFKNGLDLDIVGALALVNTVFDSKNNVNIIPNASQCNVAVFNDFETKSGTGTVSGAGCAALFTGAKYLSVALAE